MRVRVLATVLSILLIGAGLCAVPQGVQAQSERSAEASSGEQTDAQRAAATLSTLEPLLEALSALEEDAETLAAQIDSSGEGEKDALKEDLERVNSEIDNLRDQVSVISTGISEADYRAGDNVDFDLRNEIEKLIEPFVSVLLGATEGAREIEHTRRDLKLAQERLTDSAQALASIEATFLADASERATKVLTAQRELWTERHSIHEAQVAALQRQLDDLNSNRSTAGRKVDSAVQGFFRERGLNLALGLGAFLVVFGLCRGVRWAARRASHASQVKKTFAHRLAGLLFTGFTMVASFVSMLFVFNARNDWLLVGLMTLFAMAMLWVMMRMLPSLIEQITLLLNLGAVQEDERVVMNGIPFRVEKLDFYTDLRNPDLGGGEFTLPVRELVGLHSRPAGRDEAWFPSKKGDWVRLGDGNTGQILVQTPEVVELCLLGGARVTYQTTDYLAQNPENLSHGFRIEIEFGIGYDHIAEATGKVISTMQRQVEAHMAGFVGVAHLRQAEVEFLRAGASSLDYEVELDVTGDVAHRFEEIERELARVLVEIANREGWEIPFQQIVLHNR